MVGEVVSGGAGRGRSDQCRRKADVPHLSPGDPGNRVQPLRLSGRVRAEASRRSARSAFRRWTMISPDSGRSRESRIRRRRPVIEVRVRSGRPRPRRRSPTRPKLIPRQEPDGREMNAEREGWFRRHRSTMNREGSDPRRPCWPGVPSRGCPARRLGATSNRPVHAGGVRVGEEQGGGSTHSSTPSQRAAPLSAPRAQRMMITPGRRPGPACLPDLPGWMNVSVPLGPGEIRSARSRQAQPELERREVGGSLDRLPAGPPGSHHSRPANWTRPSSN